jgi:hypothetical protein
MEKKDFSGDQLIGKPKFTFDNKSFMVVDEGDIDKKEIKAHCTCTVTNLKGETYSFPILEKMVRIYKDGVVSPRAFNKYPMYAKEATFEYLTRIKK